MSYPVSSKLTNSDGLHLTAKGYEVIFNEIVKIVDEHWPELKPENLPMRLPQYVDVG